MNSRLTACAALALLLALPAQAAMYKWVDANGTVVYSQTPPPDQGKAKVIAPPPPPAAPAEPAQASAEKPDPAAAQDQEDEQHLKAREEFEAALRKNCEISRKNLETYKSAPKIITPDNQVVNLDEKTRAAKIKQAEQDISTYCK